MNNQYDYEFGLIDFRPVGECWPERVKVFRNKEEAISTAKAIIEAGCKLMTIGMDGPVQTTLNELTLSGSCAIFPSPYIDLPDSELDIIKNVKPDAGPGVVTRYAFVWWAKSHKQKEGANANTAG